MIAGARRLPIQHLSIRVPWHDAGWTGVVCNKPAGNLACRVLRRIADAKDDSAEAAVAGKSLADLSPDQFPACMAERSTFMAPFPITVTNQHPYARGNSDSHGHFRPTRYTMQPYSAACVPFRWMLHEEGAELVERYDLGFQPDREPDFGFDPDWIQDRANQLVMLDTFFGAVQPRQSLCFFYAKDTPLSSSAGRVIVGVGLVRDVGAHVEYKYSTTSPPHRSVIWERNVEHSIRPDFEEGFVFPLQELSDLAVEKGLDPEQFLAFAPDDAFWSFSYASEHVSHDHAIAAVLNCIRALDRIETVLPGPWRRAKAWLDQQLNRLWRLRGPFPGFGSALSAFLGDGGNLVAYELADQSAEGSGDGNADPWLAFEEVMRAPDRSTDSANKLIGKGFANAWLAMAPERKELLKLLSRFSIEASQAVRFFDPDQRPGDVEDMDLLSNPYLLYERHRLADDPISVMTIDRGMLPDRVILNAHPLPERSQLADKIDPRRVRALLVAALEHSAEQGHTLLPRSRLKASIDKMPLETDCPVGPEVIAGLGDFLVGVVDSIDMADGSPAYQLQRFTETARLIRRMVQKRLGPRSRRHQSTHDFRTVVDEALRKPDASDRASEERARTEKAAALAELFASRLSVLVGGAGTGKTTLLKMLCGLSDVSTGGVLLLAPTGKARVQLETKTEMEGGLTIAQFLMRYGGRYDPDTGRYRVTASTDRCGNYRTVIVDECSMLTEEQLAALLDGLSGVDRLILVGDRSQLPPIGSGRPLVDIVEELKPEGVERHFPRVGRGYAELTVPRRQKGKTRADLLLASWFGGTPDPAADEIWDRLETEEMEEIGFESWSDGEDLHRRLLSLIVKELDLAGADDEIGFECSLGATVFKGGTYFNCRYGDDDDRKAERWQIVSPVRGAEHGVGVLNRVVQRSFRSKWMERAMHSRRGRKVHRPSGPQGIIYGDKVINLKNSTRRRVYPERQSYVANGDVGIVVGNYKRRKQRRLFARLEVEFTSQPGHAYDFGIGEFSAEEGPPLELAYALTVHKTQGSEFGITFVVLPNPCWLLSRELLYTALTRQTKRVIILHQGNVRELRRYASEKYSDIARRLTNLFGPPSPISVEVNGSQRFLENRLIHRTKRGDLVRSKSEVIIANELLAQGVDRYEYEAQLRLPSGQRRYPDFTIIDDDTGERYYWEHLGLLHDPDYKSRGERKLAAYRAADIRPHEEGGGEAGTLIITRDDEVGGIDAKQIADLVVAVLL